MSLNPCNVSCGGCQQLREEVEGLRREVEHLEARLPLEAVPEWLTDSEATDEEPLRTARRG